jgi:hypothetical protein
MVSIYGRVLRAASWALWAGAHCSSLLQYHSNIAAARVRITRSILGGQLYTARVKQARRIELFHRGLRPPAARSSQSVT